jgi:hypothetical protein
MLPDKKIRHVTRILCLAGLVPGAAWADRRNHNATLTLMVR